MWREGKSKNKNNKEKKKEEENNTEKLSTTFNILKMEDVFTFRDEKNEDGGKKRRVK